MARTLKPEDRISHYRVVWPAREPAAWARSTAPATRDLAARRGAQDPPARAWFRARSACGASRSRPSPLRRSIIPTSSPSTRSVRTGCKAAETDSSPLHYISMELVSGKTLGRQDPRGEDRPQDPARLAGAGGRGRGQGARGGDRPPRLEARQHHGDERRLCQGARLRAREAHRASGHRLRPRPERGCDHDRAESTPAKAQWSAPPATWRPSRCGAGGGRAAPMCSRSAACCTRRRRAGARSRRTQGGDDAPDPARRAGADRGGQPGGAGRAAAT